MTHPELPDLTTPEGLAVASDLLQERGWSRCEMTLEGLWSLCPDEVLHELACRYAEQVLAIWEREHPEDDRPRRALEAKRGWLQGEVDDRARSKARRAVMLSLDGTRRGQFERADAVAAQAARAAAGPTPARAASRANMLGDLARTLDNADGGAQEEAGHLALTIALMLEVRSD